MRNIIGRNMTAIKVTIVNDNYKLVTRNLMPPTQVNKEFYTFENFITVIFFFYMYFHTNQFKHAMIRRAIFIISLDCTHLKIFDRK